MHLNEETGSAIAEIGNLCIAGGSNKISGYSEEIVDISVVQAEIKDSKEIVLEIDPTDTCKVHILLKVDGDVDGQFIIRISDEILDQTLEKFPKLDSAQKDLDRVEQLQELVDYFLSGFAEGMTGMTGLAMNPVGSAKKIETLDLDKLPKKVLCYSSVISVGDERIDFDVFFFSDAEVLIPKVLQSLGM